MFEKIQHPNTGKWHKISSAIGAKLIENYSKKLKLTGGAMDLRPGAGIGFYLNEVNKEWTHLRQQLYYYSANPLANMASLTAIWNAAQLAHNTGTQITARDGVFNYIMEPYFSGQMIPAEAQLPNHLLKQIIETINANEQGFLKEFSALREAAYQQEQQVQQQQQQQQQYPPSAQAARGASAFSGQWTPQTPRAGAVSGVPSRAAPWTHQMPRAQSARAVDLTGMRSRVVPDNLLAQPVAQNPDDEVEITGSIGPDDRQRLAYERGEVSDLT